MKQKHVFTKDTLSKAVAQLFVKMSGVYNVFQLFWNYISNLASYINIDLICFVSECHLFVRTRTLFQNVFFVLLCGSVLQHDAIIILETDVLELFVVVRFAIGANVSFDFAFCLSCFQTGEDCYYQCCTLTYFEKYQFQAPIHCDAVVRNLSIS